MQAVISELGLAVVLFVSTNIDDVLVLLAFFADARTRMRDIVVGQYVGIGALYFASLIASLLSLVIAPAYIGLLGVVPILIGVTKLRDSPSGESDDDEMNVAARSSNAARLWSVAAITIANGGDNIGIYTPVFATRPLHDVLLIGAVFAVLVALWCLAARWLVAHPQLGAPIRRYGNKLVPYVLIAVGLLVLWEAGSFMLLTSALATL